MMNADPNDLIFYDGSIHFKDLCRVYTFKSLNIKTILSMLKMYRQKDKPKKIDVRLKQVLPKDNDKITATSTEKDQ